MPEHYNKLACHRQMSQRFLDFFGRVFVIDELAGKVFFISCHVEVAMTAQVEKDCPFLAFLGGWRTRSGLFS
jgi:hypothetical protein